MLPLKTIIVNIKRAIFVDILHCLMCLNEKKNSKIKTFKTFNKWLIKLNFDSVSLDQVYIY